VRRLVLLLATLAAAGCGGAARTAPPTEPAATTAAADALPRGGTLRVALVEWADHEQQYTAPDGKADYALDPQAEYDTTTFELFRCCLLRTLMSYNGRSTADGGAELRPDLADGAPTISSDGLAWTFRLKPGLRYAPPYEDREIVAADIVRAVERTFRAPNASWAGANGLSTLGQYAFYYAPAIEGTQAFADGKADSISGLETPDDHTLVVHLTEPAGDLGERFSLPATAPIPPGAADGHDDGYGPFLVASGPYLVEQYVRGKTLMLARNPSWDPATDPLRAAYPDRIELTMGLDRETAYRKVERGMLDLVLEEPAPDRMVQRYVTTPSLRDRVHLIPQDALVYGAMNLAAPPFDDVHVRRAANLVVDKQDLVERAGGGLAARVAKHLAPDSLEGNLLLDYDPYATPNEMGDLAAAKAEMAQSRYDTNGDGRCDADVCSRVPTLSLGDLDFSLLAKPLEKDFARLGIELDVEELPSQDAFHKLATQPEPIALTLAVTWVKDFPNASGWFPGALSGSEPAANASLVGVDSEQLAKWGYPVTSVPSIDSEIAECLTLVAGAQTSCWAELDQLVMEQIAPWIPYYLRNQTRIVSSRVAAFSVDESETLPALDRIALKASAG
jgi:peptide/nickel transport system substrate-binding protein